MVTLCVCVCVCVITTVIQVLTKRIINADYNILNDSSGVKHRIAYVHALNMYPKECGQFYAKYPSIACDLI